MGKYHDYISSVEWRERAAEAKERVGYRCQICNADDVELHAHHRTYERLGHEDAADITILCYKCHAIFHNKIAHEEAALAMLDDLPNALTRWGIPAYSDDNYVCDNQWDYYESAKRLIRLGSAWLGSGDHGARDGNGTWYGAAIKIVGDYLLIAHESCPKCDEARRKRREQQNGEG